MFLKISLVFSKNFDHNFLKVFHKYFSIPLNFLEISKTYLKIILNVFSDFTEISWALFYLKFSQIFTLRVEDNDNIWRSLSAYGA